MFMFSFDCCMLAKSFSCSTWYFSVLAGTLGPRTGCNQLFGVVFLFLRMHFFLLSWDGIVARPSASRRSHRDDDVSFAVWRRTKRRTSAAHPGIIRKFALFANIRGVAIVENDMKGDGRCGLKIQAFVVNDSASAGIAVKRHARQQWNKHLDKPLRWIVWQLVEWQSNGSAHLAMTLLMIGGCC